MSTAEGAQPAEGAEPPRPVCRSCGTTAAPGEDAAALTWSLAVEAGRTSWTCPDCTRRHVRGIEGRLDTAWW